MFCGECGTKNEAGAAFCANCGNKFEATKNVVTADQTKKVPAKSKTVKKENQVAPEAPINNTANEVVAPVINSVQVKDNKKRNKIIIISIIIVAVLASAYYYLNEFIYSPKVAATEFMEAVKDGDMATIFDYIEIKESDFVSKEILEKYSENGDMEIDIDYEIRDVDVDGDEAEVRVRVEYDGDSESIDLEFESQKSIFLIFKEWNIKSESVEEIYGENIFTTIEDYEIKVFKDSVVTINEKELDSKYLDKDESDDEYDVYIIPEILGLEYEIKVEIFGGIVIEETITPSEYFNEYELDYISSDDISKEAQEEMMSGALNDLSELYNYAIEGKTYDDIKDQFKDDEIKDIYTSILSAVVGYNYTLTSLEITGSELSYLSLDGNTIDISMDIDYDFKMEVENLYDGSIEQIEKSDDTYLNLSVEYIDGEYHLVDALYVITYFSSY